MSKKSSGSMGKVLVAALPLLAFGAVWLLGRKKAEAASAEPVVAGPDGPTKQELRAQVRVIEAQLAKIGVEIAMTAGDPALAADREQKLAEFSRLNRERAKLKAQIGA